MPQFLIKTTKFRVLFTSGEAAGQDIEGALSGNTTGTFKRFRSKDMFKNVYYCAI